MLKRVGVVVAWSPPTDRALAAIIAERQRLDRAGWIKHVHRRRRDVESCRIRRSVFSNVGQLRQPRRRRFSRSAGYTKSITARAADV
jgi:hypothetical protein